MNLTTRLRLWLAGGLVKAMTWPLVPQWARHSFMAPTFRALTEEGYRANGAVFACISALAFAFHEPDLRLWEEDDSGRYPLTKHPLQDLLRRPNPQMGLAELLQYTITYMAIGGNCYWYKVRSSSGRVVRLWPLHDGIISPVPGQDTLVGGYEWDTGSGRKEQIPARDIVHFKWMPDPLQPWRGLAPLVAVAREVDTDNEATKYVFALLKNDAIPRTIIQAPTEAALGDDQVRRMKQQFREFYGGERRGDVAILEGGATVQRLSLDMQELAADALRRVPEARICAAFRVPPIVAGLNVGLERCLPADARVWTLKGPIRIADIRPGDIVWSFVSGRLELRRVTNWFRMGHRRLYEIRTKNRIIRATDNHPLLVRVPGEIGGGCSPSYTWKCLDQLQRGDYIVQAKSLPDQGITTLPDGQPATAEMLRFCGALIGDGTVNVGHSVSMAMPPTDRCYQAYRDLAESLFTKYRAGGQRPWKRASDGLTGEMMVRRENGESYAAIGRIAGISAASARDRIITAQNPKPEIREAIHICVQPRSFCFGSKEASLWLAELGLAGTAKTKRVPAWVYGLRRDLRLAFLAGIVDSDGYIDARGCLTVTLANEALLHDIRDLAISVGIQCSNADHQVMAPDVLPNPGKEESYQSWRFTASSALQIAEIPFEDPLYRERVEANRQRHRPDGFDADRAGLADTLGFYFVRSIREAPTEETYDIEVEGGHSFIANGIIVHNSTYANYQESVRALTERTLVPLWRIVEDEITADLLPEFAGRPGQTVGFDMNSVGVLEELRAQEWGRVGEAVKGGWLSVNEARARIGYPAVASGDVFIRSLAQVTESAQPVPPGKAKMLLAGLVNGQFKVLPAGERKVSDRARQARLLAEAIVTALSAERREVAGRLETAVDKWFAGLADQVVHRALTWDGGKAVKQGADLPEAEELLPFTDFEELEEEVRRFYVELLQLSWGTWNTALGVDVAFDLEDPAVTRALATSGTRIKQIHETTLEEIRDLLVYAHENGWSVDHIVRGDPEDEVDGLRAIVEETYKGRARTIARTELGRAQNEAGAARFAASGVERTLLLDDGVEDSAPGCIVLGNDGRGTIVPTEWYAAHPLGHPNCLRAGAPYFGDEPVNEGQLAAWAAAGGDRT